MSVGPQKQAAKICSCEFVLGFSKVVNGGRLKLDTEYNDMQ